MAGTPAPPGIFSPARRVALRQRMAALQQGPDPARYLFADVAEDVAERLAFLRHRPARALVIGDPGGQIAQALAPHGAEVLDADPAPGLALHQFDLEQPWPTAGFDLVVATFVFDTANDLPGALIHARGALASGGLLLVTMLGAGSLPALRAIMLAADGERAAPRLHPQVDVRAGAQLLQRAGLSRPVADSRGLDVRFSSLGSLTADLRAQGLGNALSQAQRLPGRAALSRARAEFAALADEQGRVTEHFELLTLTGWRG